MKYSKHDDLQVAFTEIDAVRKPLGNGFAYAVVQHRELFGHTGDALDQELEFGQEFYSGPRAFLFLPIACLVKLASRLPAKDDLAH